MQIENDRVVLIGYRLTDDEGQVIDTSEGREPLSYLHGAGGIIPGLEAALVGKSTGEQLHVVVDPENAYGAYDKALRQEVERERFSDSDSIDVGMRFRVPVSDGGQGVVEVVEVKEDSVIVDGNHALAGMRLHFDVTIRDVRDATEQELTHGHVHEGGKDH